MKYLFLVILFFVNSLVFSQRFSSDYWHNGTLYFKKGDSLDMPIKYDLVNSVVYTNEDNKLKTWSAGQIKGFKFIDAQQKIERKFKTIYYKKEDGFSIPIMFEVIYSGTKISLFRRDLVYARRASYNPFLGLSLPLNSKVENHEFYAVNTKNQVLLFEPNKKSIISVFAPKEETIKNYIKENKVKFQTIEDIIRIFEFYNSL